MTTMHRNDEESCKDFLERLSQENRQFYESDRGGGALKDLQQKFPHVWLYVAELIQNAVDEKATVIRLEIVNDKTLIFEHDGEAFDYDRDVIGLCTKGISSKGAGTVGFMGVGFKAVFRSYETVKISSGDWKFYLKVDVTIGKEFGDKQRNWLGSVLPIWDNSIPEPSEGMTCRFELTDRIEKKHSIESDLQAVFKNDKAILPLLARQNVQELDWNSIKWILSIDKDVPFQDGTGNRFHISALSSDESDKILSWIIFSQEYIPSRDAIRRFLEHRQLIPRTKEEEDKIYRDAKSKRRVEAFFQTDEKLFPILPDMGEAYALLPTSVNLPIGINIQADWLLTQSRQELMDTDLKDNQWHKEIIENIPKITKRYFEWITSDDGPYSGTWKTAYKILPTLDQNSQNSFGWFLGVTGVSDYEPSEFEYCKILHDELLDSKFIATHISATQIKFIKPDNARVLPEKLSIQCGEKLDLRPWDLFGNNIASRGSLGQKAVNTLIAIGLLMEMSAHELEIKWNNGEVKIWYESFSEEERDHKLETLLHGLSEMDNDDEWENANLKCLPSEANNFISRNEAVRFPGEWNIIVNEQDFAISLIKHVADQEKILKWNFDRTITSRQQHLKTNAKDYIYTINQPKLVDVVSRWWNDVSCSDISNEINNLIVRFTLWVAEKQSQRRDLIQRIICVDKNNNHILLHLNKALLEQPYAGYYRKNFFKDFSSVSDVYLKYSNTVDWRSFFESCNPSPKGRFYVKIDEKKIDSQQLELMLGDSSIVPSTRASSLELSWSKDENINVSYNKFTYIDFKIPDHIYENLKADDKDYAIPFFKWIKDNPGGLKLYSKVYILYIPYNNGFIRELNNNLVPTWIKQLNEIKWLFTPQNIGPFSPQEILKAFDQSRPTAPVADALPDELASILESGGVKFGTLIPKAGPMQKLQHMGSSLSPKELADLVEALVKEDLEESDDYNENISTLNNLLNTLPLIPVPKGINLLDGTTRIPFNRIVKRAGMGFRSNLGWLVALEDLKNNSDIIRTFDCLKDYYKFPDRTTALQSIDFLKWVWSRQPDVDSVRRYLAFSFAYINEEISTSDETASEWQKTLPNALVYTLGRQWVRLGEDITIYFDDLQASDFQVISKQQLVTPTHLGQTERLDQQQAAANLLGLRLLSNDFVVQPVEGARLSTPSSWINNFFDIQRAVLGVLNLNEYFDEYDDAENSEESIRKQILEIRKMDSLVRNVIRTADNQILATKQVYALQKGIFALVAGEPADFSSDLCNLLISYYNAGRKKNISQLASEMTRLIILIDHDNFDYHLINFNKKYGIAVATEAAEGEEPNRGEKDTKSPFPESTSEPSDETRKTEEGTPTDGESDHRDAGQVTNKTPLGVDAADGKSQSNSQPKPMGGGAAKPIGSPGSEVKPPIKPSHGYSGHPGQTEAAKKSSRMLSYVSGETTSSDDEYEITDDESPENIEIGRAAESFVIGFEKDRGWKPKNMNEISKNHSGYDIESTGPDGKLIYIEVKGINGPWTTVGVGLTPTQFKYASKYQDDYFLYVVENALSSADAKAYRIKNPAQQITKFQFDHGWKNLALSASDSIEQPENENKTLVDRRVKIMSMNKEGSIREIIEMGQFKKISIKLDDGESITKVFNPIDIILI